MNGKAQQYQAPHTPLEQVKRFGGNFNGQRNGGKQKGPRPPAEIDPRNVIDPLKAVNAIDRRTTAMLRNFPYNVSGFSSLFDLQLTPSLQFTHEKLINWLNASSYGHYDFVYLRMGKFVLLCNRVYLKISS